MSIYKELINAVTEGMKFKINLVNKSLQIGKQKIIENGKVINKKYENVELILPSDLEPYFSMQFGTLNMSFTIIERLYEDYKHSVPSKNYSDTSYFKALSVDGLTDGDLYSGEDRNLSQAKLEGYILLASLAGWFIWPNENHWFWKGIDDSVVLKSWIQTNHVY